MRKKIRKTKNNECSFLLWHKEPLCRRLEEERIPFETEDDENDPDRFLIWVPDEWVGWVYGFNDGFTEGYGEATSELTKEVRDWARDFQLNHGFTDDEDWEAYHRPQKPATKSKSKKGKGKV